MNKFIRLFNTVKYLKPIQIYFRLFYFVRARVRRVMGFNPFIQTGTNSTPLTLASSIYAYDSYDNNKFHFLNLVKIFDKKIDWNYDVFGKLWTYNLSYFDFLHQKKMRKDEGLKLIYDFIENDVLLKDAKEPFPISLRGINWIKFLTYHAVTDAKIDNVLYSHYTILLDNIEYHLLGNHLLENGFSLLFGAYYFEDQVLYVKAKEILEAELEEQVLKDGAHFELSPMYHQIMLYRVLDCMNLISNNNFKNQELLELLSSKASLMLAWLKNMTLKDGNIPLLNDSANGIAPTSKELFEYARRLKIATTKLHLKESGYRKVVMDSYECIVDVGQIGADYIPGHAHSDTFNFIVQVKDKPFIVDTGLSTYETNERRTNERSTSSHNTVEVNATDQSEVWGGFRVANRAKVIDIKEDSLTIEATHDGYKKDAILHTRKWLFEDSKIIIEDSLSKEAGAVARIHFHPDVTREGILDAIVTNGKIEFIEYKYAPEFNKLIDAIAIEIRFKQKLKVEINI